MDDGREPLCAYRRAKVIRGAKSSTDERERSPVAVGDRVRVSTTGSRDGVVEGVCARRNRLARPAPGRDEKNVHVLVANVDCVAVVASAANPEFSPGLVERFVIAAQAEGIPPILCVNKVDLLPAGQARPWSIYRELGYEVVECSVRSGVGIVELRARLLDRAVAFCGHSGVGKTSLLRALIGEEIGRVGDVSDATGKGRHTTTGAVLLHGPGRSRWIDTPGVREFGLLGLTPERLREFYPELASLACTQAVCGHLDEPDCQARGLPRYPQYRRILESLRAGEN
jgi:ribosome biogenesis GTPase